MENYRINYIGNRSLYIPCSTKDSAYGIAKEESKKQNVVEVRELKSSRWNTIATASKGKISEK